MCVCSRCQYWIRRGLNILLLQFSLGRLRASAHPPTKEQPYLSEWGYKCKQAQRAASSGTSFPFIWCSQMIVLFSTTQQSLWFLGNCWYFIKDFLTLICIFHAKIIFWQWRNNKQHWKQTFRHTISKTRSKCLGMTAKKEMLTFDTFHS